MVKEILIMIKNFYVGCIKAYIACRITGKCKYAADMVEGVFKALASLVTILMRNIIYATWRYSFSFTKSQAISNVPSDLILLPPTSSDKWIDHGEDNWTFAPNYVSASLVYY